MAIEAPDPKTFGSWEEAFQYPIVTVRSMERQLRGDIETNQGRLRALVGSSYRDLLGTAETIIDLDERMRLGEDHLAGMGKMCNSGLLEKKAVNMRSWVETIGGADTKDLAFAAQLALLRGCSEALAKSLRTGGSVLLAAKVLVISRLQHKKLSSGSKSLVYLDTIRSRLAGLRRKLLIRIDRILERQEITEEALLGAMCAFILATSSSATDVLRHYHQVRLEFLGKQARDDRSINVSLLQTLQYVIQTLKDTKTYIPGKLAQALQAIKATPIFQCEELHSVKELKLDVHERWIDEDIKMFIPYIRDVELKKAEAGRVTKDWSKQAFLLFSTILQGRLRSITDATAIVKHRQQILGLWFSTSQRSLGVDTEGVFEKLHDVFITQTIRLIQSQTISLQSTTKAIEDTLYQWTKHSLDNSSTLWASSIIGKELSSGGKAFTDLVFARFNGRYEASEAPSIEYKLWLQRIGHLDQMMNEIRETKWDGVIDNMEDDDDSLEDKLVILSGDDPRLLQDEFREILRKSFTSLQDSIKRFASELVEPNRGEKAAYLLRVWKDVRYQLPPSHRDSDVDVGSISDLQELMATLAIHGPLSTSKKLMIKAHHEQPESKALWDGDPQSPIFPASWVFRLLHDVVHSMTSLGSDIWDAPTTDILRGQLRVGLASHFKGSLISVLETDGGQSGSAAESIQKHHECDEEHLPNGEMVSDRQTAPMDVNQDSRTQLLFDMLYLDVTTARGGGIGDRINDDLAGLLQVVEIEVGLDEGSRRRMRRSAEEYWKRTSLMFALLA